MPIESTCSYAGTHKPCEGSRIRGNSKGPDPSRVFQTLQAHYRVRKVSEDGPGYGVVYSPLSFLSVRKAKQKLPKNSGRLQQRSRLLCLSFRHREPFLEPPAVVWLYVDLRATALGVVVSPLPLKSRLVTAGYDDKLVVQRPRAFRIKDVITP